MLDYDRFGTLNILKKRISSNYITIRQLHTFDLEPPKIPRNIPLTLKKPLPYQQIFQNLKLKCNVTAIFKKPSLKIFNK